LRRFRRDALGGLTVPFGVVRPEPDGFFDMSGTVPDWHHGTSNDLLTSHPSRGDEREE
jgi:hypothetical protein